MVVASVVSTALWHDFGVQSGTLLVFSHLLRRFARSPTYGWFQARTDQNLSAFGKLGHRLFALGLNLYGRGLYLIFLGLFI